MENKGKFIKATEENSTKNLISALNSIEKLDINVDDTIRDIWNKFYKITEANGIISKEIVNNKDISTNEWVLCFSSLMIRLREIFNIIDLLSIEYIDEKLKTKKNI